MPNFIDGKDDINDFLHRFEKLAGLQGWDSNDYHIFISVHFWEARPCKLTLSLPDDICEDYSQLKDALLKAYNVDADSYSKRFRESKVGEKETYIQLITRMTQYLDHWLIMGDVKKDYDSFDFLTRDQLLSNRRKQQIGFVVPIELSGVVKHLLRTSMLLRKTRVLPLRM